MSSSSSPLNPSRTSRHEGPLEESCYHRQLNICTVIYSTILGQMSAVNGKSMVFTRNDFGMVSSTEGSLVRTKVGPLRTLAFGFVTQDLEQCGGRFFACESPRVFTEVIEDFRVEPTSSDKYFRGEPIRQKVLASIAIRSTC